MYIETKKKDKPAAASSTTTTLPTTTTPPIPPTLATTSITEDSSTTASSTPTPAARAKALKKRLKQINEIKEKMLIDTTYQPDVGQLSKLASEEGLIKEFEALEI